MNKQITLSQRYQIQAYLEAGLSKPKIADKLCFSSRAIQKEVKRNSKNTSNGDVYLAEFAEHLCRKRHKLKPKKIKLTYAVRRRIIFLIKCDWSPEQIADTCKLRGIEMASHEAIYLFLYAQKRKGNDYCTHLRRAHRKRRKRKNKNERRQIIKDKVSIDQRPAIASENKEVGHCEIDLVKCTNGYLLTITDKKSLFNIIRKLPNKSSNSVLIALISLAKYFPLFKTITSDNGTEFAKHKQAAALMGVEWFFADPYKSQQRGCNENQNGLIRQYLKNGTDLNQVSEQQILKVERKLNYRPRKKIGFLKPFEIFLQLQKYIS